MKRLPEGQTKKKEQRSEREIHLIWKWASACEVDEALVEHKSSAV
jgi:hypothetical protein